MNCFAKLSCLTNTTKLKNNPLKLQGSQIQIWPVSETLSQLLTQSSYSFNLQAFLLTSTSFDSKKKKISRHSYSCPTLWISQIEIYVVKPFLSCLRIQPGQFFRLFCSSELIRNPFWPNGLFMSPLLHTPTLQPRSKFVSK